MTFAEQKDLVWAGLGTDSGAATDLVTASNIDAWLTSWEFEIVRQILLLPRERWADFLNPLISSASNNGNGSIKRWNLPPDIFAGGDYIVTVNSIAATRVDSSYERINTVNNLMTSGALDPVYYIFNNQINYGIAPANGVIAKLYYVKNPLGIVGGSSSLLPKILHQTGVWYCLREAFTIDGDDLQVAQFNEKYLNESRTLIQ